MTTMRCTALLIAGSVLTGCLGLEDRDPPRPTAVLIFDDGPQMSGVAGPRMGAAGRPIEQDAGFIPPSQISARLEGTLLGIRLDDDTTQNNGYLDAWGQGNGYLHLDVAALGEGGAGMILLGLPGGVRHPVFEDGYWSSASQGVGPASDDREAPFPMLEDTWVGSCAGPSLGEFPYEQSADAFEMTATEDPNDPGIVVLVVRSTFGVAEGRSTDVTATIELRSMDELEARQLGQ